MIRHMIAALLACLALAGCGGGDQPARVHGHSLTLWNAYDQVRDDCTPAAAKAFKDGKGGADPCMPAAVVQDASKQLKRDPCVEVPRGAKWVPLVDAVGDLADEMRLTGWDGDAAALERDARGADC